MWRDFKTAEERSQAQRESQGQVCGTRQGKDQELRTVLLSRRFLVQDQQVDRKHKIIFALWLSHFLPKVLISLSHDPHKEILTIGILKAKDLNMQCGKSKLSNMSP